MGDKTICTRKNCTFYGRPQTGTCDYRTITGDGRGCSIAECLRFTTEPYERINAGKFNPDTNSNRVKEVQDMREKRDWDAIISDYQAGMVPKELSVKYNIEISQLNAKIRKWKIENGIPVMTRKKTGAPAADVAPVSPPEAMPGQSPADDGNAPHGAENGIIRPSKDERTGVAKYRWYSNDLKRIADVADTLDELDSLKLYREYSKVMQAIVAEMCETRLREVGAFERAQKERSDGHAYC